MSYRLLRLPLLVLALAALAPLAASAQPPSQRQPNIVFLLADDLGFGDLGCYGSTKIRTPSVDRLAAEGRLFTQHYSGNAVCATSRCVLMTGMHPGHAFIRSNKEVQPEGQYPIPADSVTLAELLQAQGYVTGGFGKWGLGGPGSEGEPLKQGFDRFFGYNCQRVAHNFYPTFLWDDDQRITLDNPEFSAHQKLPADADPNDPASYDRYKGNDYAPDLISEQALRFIKDNKDRPFFLYYPTTVPHLALQVPDDSLEEYVGKFEESPYPGGRGYLPHRYPRSAYAAMITRMDREIGRMIALVEELELDEQTLFVFTSDNGPVYERLGNDDNDFFRSAGDLRGRKGTLYEGGIRAPLVVRWKGTIDPGTRSDAISGFEDWMPTLLELAGAPQAVPEKSDGVSIVPALLGKPQPERPFLYREYPSSGGQQSVRVGDWKAIRQNLVSRSRRSQPEIKTELYNLTTDPNESQDVAADNPDVLAQLEQLLAEQHVPSELFPIPVLDGTR